MNFKSNLYAIFDSAKPVLLMLKFLWTKLDWQQIKEISKSHLYLKSKVSVHYQDHLRVELLSQESEKSSYMNFLLRNLLLYKV